MGMVQNIGIGSVSRSEKSCNNWIKTVICSMMTICTLAMNFFTLNALCLNGEVLCGGFEETTTTLRKVFRSER